MTTGFMPCLYDNHQAEKGFGEYSQNDVYIRIAYNSFLCVCVCVCVCV